MTAGSEGVSRRRFLLGSTAAVGGAVLVAGCTGGGAGGGNTAGTGPGTVGSIDADLDAAAVLGGLEKLAADTYAAVSLLTTTGKLGAAVPPAIGALVAGGIRQHNEALDAWNKVLDGGKRSMVTSASATLKPLVDAAAGGLSDIIGAATLALRVEDHLSQTYQNALPLLGGADLVRMAARLNVVGEQRQAVLRYMLGMNPVGSGIVREAKDFAPADPQPALITG